MHPFGNINKKLHYIGANVAEAACLNVGDLCGKCK